MLRKHSPASLFGQMFNCLLVQIANQPITPLGAGSVHLGLWMPGGSSERRQNAGGRRIEVTLKVVSRVVGARRPAALSVSGIFTSKPSLGFTENEPKRRANPESSACVEENASLMSGVRGQTSWRAQKSDSISTKFPTTGEMMPVWI